VQGDRGLRDALNAAGAGVIACDAPDLGVDIDTPDDLAAAVARGWLDPLE
jgi:molybdenum cofactor cytidylyltransferase